MFQRSFLTGLAVTLLVVQACGSDDGKRKVTASDAGMGGEAGAEPNPDSGGSSAGEPPLPMGGEPGGGTGGSGEAGMPPIAAGAGGEPPYVPEPELLFSVKSGAVGLENTGIQTQTSPGNAIYTSNTGSQAADDGTNGVKVLGADLGLDGNDNIASFTELQPEPQNPMYFFSIADGSEGSSSSRISESWWDGEPVHGDVYFSDGVPSWECDECGGGTGYNGLLATEVSLGLWPGTEGDSDDLTGLFVHDANREITELYFTVQADAVGAEGSAVASVPAAERGCTIFRSALDGTNSVAFDCTDLGLVADDQIDALLVYGDQAADKIVFSVSCASQGVAATAVAESVINGNQTGAKLFESDGAGGNTLFKDVEELGLNPFNSLSCEDLDGLAVIEAPQPTVVSASTCNLTYDPFGAAEGGFTTLGGAIPIGPGVLVVAGQTATTARLIAYNPVTCAQIQQKDMPAGFDDPTTLAIVPLAGWAATAPLDNVEYFRATSAGPGLDRYDAAGGFVESFPLVDVDYYALASAAIYEPVADKLYVLYEDYDIGQRLHLAMVARPAAAAPSLTADLRWLSAPCIVDPAVTGVDALGNLYIAQHQGQLNTTQYRVCTIGSNGELQLAPYWWAPAGPIEQLGFIAGGSSHFLLSTNSGVGPSAIERGVFQAP